MAKKNRSDQKSTLQESQKSKNIHKSQKKKNTNNQKIKKQTVNSNESKNVKQKKTNKPIKSKKSDIEKKEDQSHQFSNNNDTVGESEKPQSQCLSDKKSQSKASKKTKKSNKIKQKPKTQEQQKEKEKSVNLKSKKEVKEDALNEQKQAQKRRRAQKSLQTKQRRKKQRINQQKRQKEERQKMQLIDKKLQMEAIVKKQDQEQYNDQSQQAQMMDIESSKDRKCEKYQQELKMDKNDEINQLKQRQFQDDINENQAKIEQDIQSNMNKNILKNQSQLKFKRAEPTPQQLCDALLILKQKLQHRSLEQVIKKLYQTVDEKKKIEINKHLATLHDKKKDLTLESIFSEEPPCTTEPSKSKKGESEKQPSMIFNEEESDEDDPPILIRASQRREDVSERVLFPGRKKSIYHDKVGEIAATSHQFFKQVRSDPQKLNRIVGCEPSKQFTPLFNDNVYIAQGEQIMVTYLQSDTLKTKFSSEQQQIKYNQRRFLAQSLVQKGYGDQQAWKQISPDLDHQLQKRKYKNICGGIITLAYRKLQSFVANECRKTIKYLDRQQMRTIVTTLLNFRTKFTPERCLTLSKFLQAGFGLCDVTIGQVEAVRLYLDIQRYLYGRNVTMQNLQKKGQIQNKRHFSAVVDYITNQSAYRGSVHHADSQSGSRCDDIKQEYMWNEFMDRQLIELFLKTKSLQTTRTIMIARHDELRATNIPFFKQTIRRIIQETIKQVEMKSKLSLNGPILDNLSQNNLYKILNQPDFINIRTQLMQYFLNKNQEDLVIIVVGINSHLFGDLTNEDLQILQQDLNETEYDQMIDLGSGKQKENLDMKNYQKSMKQIVGEDVKVEEESDDGIDLRMLQDLNFDDFV